MCTTESCIASDRPSKLNVVSVHKIMNSLSRAAKMMRNIIQGYSRKNTWEGGGGGGGGETAADIKSYGWLVQTFLD